MLHAFTYLTRPSCSTCSICTRIPKTHENRSLLNCHYCLTKYEHMFWQVLFINMLLPALQDWTQLFMYERVATPRHVQCMVMTI